MLLLVIAFITAIEKQAATVLKRFKEESKRGKKNKWQKYESIGKKKQKKSKSWVWVEAWQGREKC